MKKSVDQKVREILEKNPAWGRIKIAKAIQESPNTVRDALARIMAAPASFTANEVDDFILEALQKRALTPNELANAVGITAKDVQDSVKRLREKCYNIVQRGVHLSISKPGFERLPLNIINAATGHVWGLVSDTHLCCKEERWLSFTRNTNCSSAKEFRRSCTREILLTGSSPD
jgi:biotin operon repressor